MCGICGVVSAGGSVDLERGATSEHENGDRAIANENGTVHVVLDGTIYNHRELRRELERSGHRFRTQADAEVLVHLYEQHGEGFAERLRGTFAVAVWDARQRRLVLGRDRFGIKPLYYRDTGGELSFASALRPFARGEIDADALEAFLAFNSIPAPLTIFRGTRKLPAGHLLLWEDGRVRLERFVRPAPLDVRVDEEAELVEEVRSRIRDSVRAQLVSDVPVGVLLSGGVHSSLLAALAAEESSTPLPTFTIAVHERSFDELADARSVADRYGTRHRELVVLRDADLLLPALADAFDEPFADVSALPLFLVSDLAANDVNVALSGAGGDELFGAPRDVPQEIFSPRLRAELTGRQSTSQAPEKPDRASMAHSLETRVPYLDTVVTNLALALPTRDRKVLLRKAAAPLLPRKVVHGKKRGFSLPAETWLPFARDTLSATTLRRQGFFRAEVVQRLLDDHVAGRDELSRQLWGLLAFTLWHERQVERRPIETRVPVLLAER
ncbi:MAG: asparagine synthase (glutamine-hydrolyzing) [Gaiellaceae bacterium]